MRHARANQSPASEQEPRCQAQRCASSSTNVRVHGDRPEKTGRGVRGSCWKFVDHDRKAVNARSNLPWHQRDRKCYSQTCRTTLRIEVGQASSLTFRQSKKIAFSSGHGAAVRRRLIILGSIAALIASVAAIFFETRGESRPDPRNPLLDPQVARRAVEQALGRWRRLGRARQRTVAVRSAGVRRSAATARSAVAQNSQFSGNSRSSRAAASRSDWCWQSPTSRYLSYTTSSAFRPCGSTAPRTSTASCTGNITWASRLRLSLLEMN